MKLLSTADIFISDATRKSDSVYLMELGSAISRNIPLFVHGKIHLEISDQFAFALPKTGKKKIIVLNLQTQKECHLKSKRELL